MASSTSTPTRGAAVGSARRRSRVARDRRLLTAVVLVGLVVVIGVVLTAGARTGVLTLAGFLVLCAVLRASAPQRAAALVVRGRVVDVATMLVLASALTLLALTAPGV